MKKHIPTLCLLAVCIGFAFAAMVQASPLNPHHDQDHDLVPTGEGRGEYRVDAPKRVATTVGGATITGYGISYHGGPLLGTSAAPNIYYIWYGNWGTNTAPDILQNLATYIGGSSYYNINTTYKDSTGAAVKPQATFVKSVSDNYSQGTALSTSGVFNVVTRAIKSGALPLDTNAVYFVLTSADVSQSNSSTSSFCTNYCGWHTSGTYSRKAVKFAFVGNPDRCPSACEAQTSASPNGNPGADGMASVVAHELVEAVTDPQLNAWYDSAGYENADKCAWKFGAYNTNPDGSKWNMTIGLRNYYIQQNWVNAVNPTTLAQGYCALGY